MSNNHTSPSTTTRQAEAAAAEALHDADRAPTEEEERLTGDRVAEPGVAQAHQEANERGAAQEGEGRIA